MPSYVVLPPETLGGAPRYNAQSPQEALKLVPLDVDLPPRVSVVDLDSVVDLLVVEPGEGATPVVTRRRDPRKPSNVTAYGNTPSSVVVTWAAVPSADAYRVFVGDSTPVEVLDVRYEFDAPGPVPVAVAAVARGVEGRKSDPVTAAPASA